MLSAALLKGNANMTTEDFIKTVIQSVIQRVTIINKFGYGTYQLIDGYYAIASASDRNKFYAEGALFNILKEAEIFLGLN
jgi:hypothetical protein